MKDYSNLLSIFESGAKKNQASNDKASGHIKKPLAPIPNTTSSSTHPTTNSTPPSTKPLPPSKPLSTNPLTTSTSSNNMPDGQKPGSNTVSNSNFASNTSSSTNTVKNPFPSYSSAFPSRELFEKGKQALSAKGGFISQAGGISYAPSKRKENNIVNPNYKKPEPPKPIDKEEIHRKFVYMKGELEKKDTNEIGKSLSKDDFKIMFQQRRNMFERGVVKNQQEKEIKKEIEPKKEKDIAEDKPVRKNINKRKPKIVFNDDS